MKNKAVFLDRDGVINRDKGFVCQAAEFELLPDVVEMLRLFRERGYLLILITNQTGIGKGFYTRQHVEEVHAFMNTQLHREGVFFDAIYYCVHHPDTGKCLCRKPASLLVEKAIARFSIDPAQSYFIGDKEQDVQAGAGAGVKGFRIAVNSSLRPFGSLIL